MIITFISKLLPHSKLLLKVLLQTRKIIPKFSPTAPANKILLQVPLARWVSSRIILCQREILKGHEKRGRKAVIVFSVLHAIAMTIDRNDVDVEVVHRRNGVYSALYFLLPISSYGQFVWRWNSTQRSFPTLLLD